MILISAGAVLWLVYGLVVDDVFIMDAVNLYDKKEFIAVYEHHISNVLKFFKNLYSFYI